MGKILIATEEDGSQWMSLDDVRGMLGEFYGLSCAGIKDSPNEIVKTKFQEIAAKCIEHGFVRPTPHAPDAVYCACTPPHFSSIYSSVCRRCGKVTAPVT
jgi:hypothetical protein